MIHHSSSAGSVRDDSAVSFDNEDFYAQCRSTFSDTFEALGWAWGLMCCALGFLFCGLIMSAVHGWHRFCRFVKRMWFRLCVLSVRLWRRFYVWYGNHSTIFWLCFVIIVEFLIIICFIVRTHTLSVRSDLTDYQMTLLEHEDDSIRHAEIKYFPYRTHTKYTK